MTAHISAKKNEIAKTVFAAGDPLRAKHIADKFLTEVKLVSSVRNMFIYTGKYNGKKVSVMGHGMGVSSIGIYAHELFEFYKIDKFIRLGSCGSFRKEVKVGDVIVAEESLTDTTFGEAYGFKSKLFQGSQKLIDQAKKAKQVDNLHYGRITSSMWFYHPLDSKYWQKMEKQGCLATEMEASAVYAIANYFKKDALVLVTVADSFVSDEWMDPKQRQTSFNKMLKFALDAFS